MNRSEYVLDLKQLLKVIISSGTLLWLHKRKIHRLTSRRKPERLESWKEL